MCVQRGLLWHVLLRVVGGRPFTHTPHSPTCRRCRSARVGRDPSSSHPNEVPRRPRHALGLRQPGLSGRGASLLLESEPLSLTHKQPAHTPQTRDSSHGERRRNQGIVSPRALRQYFSHYFYSVCPLPRRPPPSLALPLLQALTAQLLIQSSYLFQFGVERSRQEPKNAQSAYWSPRGPHN